LISDGVHHLDEEESRHALKVLRLKPGDSLIVTDGKGNRHVAEITAATKSICHFSIKETVNVDRRKCHIHIAIAPTKNIDRREWFVEKATEIGVDEISFLNCEKSERKVVNLDRLNKKAISAMKQSGQAWLPLLHPIKTFNDMMESEGDKYIAQVDSDNHHHLKDVAKSNKYIMLIGPEGDFSPDEIAMALNNGFKKVSLGSSVLRTETAGLAACHILNLINS
jgi:16S rRNA (uracil1498-N3)-methyltransferase